MKFKLGDTICADGQLYQVIGRITYQNSTDLCQWDEYRLRAESDRSEHWLSVDDTYQEYSIWKMERFPSKVGYHEVDRGLESVVSYEGDVDVERGDRANFVEYEDATEELLISEEYWEDGLETSTGYYLDEKEIWHVRSDSSYKVKKNGSSILAIVLIMGIFISPFLLSLLSNLHFTTTISKYLKKTDKYTYVTSITGNEKQSADVYQAPAAYTIDTTAKDIISAIEGDTEYVQQDDTETEGAVAILTDKEYCVIYLSLEGNVLVQISNRKYAYTSDDDLYHGTSHSRSYYRDFYYSRGYSNDKSSYGSYSSPYSSYEGNYVDYSTSDTYYSYSSSIRQSSISARSSSGGGLSGGK